MGQNGFDWYESSKNTPTYRRRQWIFCSINMTGYNKKRKLWERYFRIKKKKVHNFFRYFRTRLWKLLSIVMTNTRPDVHKQSTTLQTRKGLRFADVWLVGRDVAAGTKVAHTTPRFLTVDTFVRRSRPCRWNNNRATKSVTRVPRR